MRGGLSVIQQTLTPEAATVLTHSIAEAGRRNHGQTTPLHVAATLLAAPTGYLRQACIRSHPNSSHPLQCRALELCFSVALERLPTAQPASGTVAEPPLSNALMAALKRAQAHQRRGCPEQQQQPLLAVKVELEQFIISILDDPSVSRVMREASFSSPAVKAAIEQAVNSQPNSGPGPKIGLGFRSGLGVAPPGAGGRSLYLNPRLQQHHQQQQGSNGFQSGKGIEDDVKRVMEILLRPKKRNPVLVGESEPREVVREVFWRIQKDEIRDKILENVEVLLVEKELGSDSSQILARLRELGGLIEKKMMMNSNGESGIILDLGGLKWLVDQPANQGVSDLAPGVVTEMGKILRKYGQGSKLWLIGTATCETYMRCQVYHPSMESEWDLQVVSILARSPVPGMLPRLGSSGGILSSSVECLSPMKSFQMAASPLTKRFSENLDPLRRLSCCPLCLEKYNQELAILQAEKSLSEEKTDATQQSLPLWLQNARLNSNDSAKGAPDSIQNKDQDSKLRQRTQELQKKWSEACLQLHPSFHQGLSSERIILSPLTMMGFYNPNLLGREPFHPKLQTQKSLGDALQLSISSSIAHQLNSDYPMSSPGSPVGTDLVLGRTKPTETAQDKTNNGCLKNFLNCISSESHNKKFDEFQGTGRPVIPADVDSFKKLLKGLMEKVWWQTEAASALASAITQCKSGNGKQRVGSRGDIWLLFSGPDRTGKKKMATALSELVCGVAPILISLGSRRDSDEPYSNFRGKTVIDQIAEAVRRNPFSVIMLQDIDETDMLIRGSIKRAMERGRLVDSYGREISLGKVIFILTSNWVPDQIKSLSGPGFTLNEEKLLSLASGGWQLRMSVGEKPSGKRSPSWLNDDHHQDRVTKPRKEVGPGCSIDLNQTANIDDDRLDGSHNSSDLTVDHEEEHEHENRESPTTSSAAPELLTFVDEAIIFKPVDFISIRHNIERTILAKFSSIAGDKFLLKLQSEAIEKILSGIWLGQTKLETWIEKVLIPSIDELKTSSTLLTHEGKMVAKLELDKELESRHHGVWLPGRISVVVDVQ